MKINSINNQTNFGKITPVNIYSTQVGIKYSPSITQHDKIVAKPSTAIFECVPSKNCAFNQQVGNELTGVLRKEKSTLYDKIEQKKIRNFFKANIEDYNGRNNAFFVQDCNGDNYLASGQEAKEIRKIRKEYPVIPNGKVHNFIQEKKAPLSCINILLRTRLGNPTKKATSIEYHSLGKFPQGLEV